MLACPSVHTVVAGAGLSGLLVACLVARRGHRVTVFDRRVGGRAQSVTLAGLPVNTGPRAIYRRGHLHKALRALGIDMVGHVPPTGRGWGFVGGSLAGLPSSPATLLTTGLLRHAGARREAALVLARLGVGALDIERNGAGGDVVGDGAEKIGAWIARHAETEDARNLIRALGRVSSYLPIGFGADDADAALVLRNVRAGLVRNVIYVDGGWSSLVNALKAVAVAAGVGFDDRAVDTDLRRADLTEACVTDAILVGADLRDAILNGVAMDEACTVRLVKETRD